MERNVKIVATIGPASSDVETIRSLILAGMNVARLNFSHGTHEQHASIIQSLRDISADLNKPIGILQDLQGPKMRVGQLPREGIKLTIGQQVNLISLDDEFIESPSHPSHLVIPFDIPDLTKSVKPGNRILLDDGNLELSVINVTKKYVEAIVTVGGILTSHKGINLPGAPLFFPGLTEKDIIDLGFGIQQGVDLVAISFVRSAEDICDIKEKIIEISGPSYRIPVIAKLERPEAIENLEEIMEVSDGVMVARGDLAVETSPAKVPVLQKKIISLANKKQKIVITATQMLESMITNPRPTRAEASDIANAVFDGTDAIMLSGETASGKFPVETVKMMDLIVREAEINLLEWGRCMEINDLLYTDDATSITHAARELAHDRNVTGIAVFTVSGRTAQLMSKARPQVPIMAFTPFVKTFQWMNILWGVKPIEVPFAKSVEEMLEHVENSMLKTEQVLPGEQVIIICGYPVGEECPPNLALLHTIRERKF